MRSRIALFAVLAAIGLTLPQGAEARWYRHGPYGYGEAREVVHVGYYPRYRHRYATYYGTDPYAYRWEPRRYYPYYNSGYWRPAAEMRFRRACCSPVIVLPPYYQAWGYPKPRYMSRAWYIRPQYRHRRHW
jgi:hypothetical protein